MLTVLQHTVDQDVDHELVSLGKAPVYCADVPDCAQSVRYSAAFSGLSQAS